MFGRHVHIALSRGARGAGDCRAAVAGGGVSGGVRPRCPGPSASRGADRVPGQSALLRLQHEARRGCVACRAGWCPRAATPRGERQGRQAGDDGLHPLRGAAAGTGQQRNALNCLQTAGCRAWSLSALPSSTHRPAVPLGGRGAVGSAGRFTPERLWRGSRAGAGGSRGHRLRSEQPGSEQPGL